ncbi:hypothetical protein [Dyella mobilis]|uniref:O-antigen ligase like membrane protein n=1 Tax=Dyella mobilis TaxID=1849582 RepID=A0ABS2KJE1_9GAMM|nr:hypothetical protein [Dyella mobilis]MBM7131020.1 hypothetical protein [Dyella mobilis]GLQ97647.1 hypothetical protein GCM10007863_20670 [Dyella mobilis]
MSPADNRSLAPPMPPGLSPAPLPRANHYRLTVRHLFLGVVLLLLLCAVVVPNSLPVTTAVAMAGSVLMALPGIRFSQSLRNLLALYACTVIVTIVYLIVGGMHGAPMEAMAEVSAVYIASPLAWMIIAEGLHRQLGAERLIEWFIWLSVLCVMSVAAFFYLFLTRGAAAVEFFFQGANVNLSEGFSGATMHVYGSLIFLAGGFFSTPELIKNKLLRFSLLVALVICALTSGRSALIISVPIGLLIGWMLSSRTVEHVGKSGIIRVLQYGLPLLIAFVAALYLLQAYTQISISSVLDIVFDKVASGGGEARAEMSRSLYQGIFENGGLGAGHGVGVTFVSDPLHPWRYEVVWLATLYRVGIVGTVIYVLPFLLYAIGVTRLALARLLPARHKFMFSGFVCAFLATNTNPYIEAFALQWMYVIPLVLWYIEYPMILKRVSQ